MAKISDGQSVKVIVPAATVIVQGNYYLIDGFFGEAMTDAVAGDELVLDIAHNECEAVQAGIVFSVGEKVYFDDVTQLFTETNTEQLVGRCTVASDAGNVFWFKQNYSA